MTPLNDLRIPIVAAPMAGGPTTVELIRAVSRAGGWGLLAAANKTSEAMAADVDELRASGVPVGVNLFVPDRPTSDLAVVEAVREKLQGHAERLGATLAEPSWDDDGYPAKVEWLVAHPVEAVTFTLGLPDGETVTTLHEVGSSVGVTVTSVDDAVAAVGRGADFLTVQGPEAGGHQSLFDLTDEPNTLPLLELLPAVCARVDVPVLASGGIATPDDVRAVLATGAVATGAVAAQVGTAFLCSSSAGSTPTHRAALASGDFSTTVLTRAFSGRYARGLANEFSARFDADAPAAYPEINRMTAPMRKKAADDGVAQWTHLWAGEGWRRTREALPDEVLVGDAGVIAQWLAAEV